MSLRACFRDKKSYDYFIIGHVHACIVVVLKRPELQKWFENSAHTRAIFFLQSLSFKHMYVFWFRNKGQSQGNEDFKSFSSC